MSRSLSRQLARELGLDASASLESAEIARAIRQRLPSALVTLRDASIAPATLKRLAEFLVALAFVGAEEQREAVQGLAALACSRHRAVTVLACDALIKVERPEHEVGAPASHWSRAEQEQWTVERGLDIAWRHLGRAALPLVERCLYTEELGVRAAALQLMIELREPVPMDWIERALQVPEPAVASPPSRWQRILRALGRCAISLGIKSPASSVAVDRERAPDYALLSGARAYRRSQREPVEALMRARYIDRDRPNETMRALRIIALGQRGAPLPPREFVAHVGHDAKGFPREAQLLAAALWRENPRGWMVPSWLVDARAGWSRKIIVDLLLLNREFHRRALLRVLTRGRAAAARRGDAREE